MSMNGGAGDDADVTIGIDLGTTCSCVGYYHNGRVVIMPNEYGNHVTASCVAFSGDQVIVGDEAKEQSSRNPENTVFEAKRLIGRRFDDDKVQRDQKFWPTRIVDDRDKPVFQVSVAGRWTKLSPEQISGHILSKMKDIAEKHLKRKVKNAVITVPAYFTNDQLTATKAAARLAGLTVKRLLPEPVAAAIAYAMDYVEEHMQRNILVFDLGGGTFDVTILQIEGNEFVVKAKGGDTHLGGADFDNKLVETFLDEIEAEHGVDLTSDAKAMRRLKNACEKAKVRLSSHETVTVQIDSLFKKDRDDMEGLDFKREISRNEFQNLCFDLFSQTIGPVEDVLEQAKMQFKDIDDLVLVGGSTRIPKIQQLIRDMFHGKELARDINPDEAVAYGAVISAGTYTLGNDLIPLNITDVTPLSLGIRVAEGKTEVIIKRGSVITDGRCEGYKFFTTAVDNQTQVRVIVVQGERVMADDNKMIGELLLENIPPQPKEKPRIKVTFKVDEDNTLKVSSRDLDADVWKELTIQNACSISEEEINHLLEQAERFRERDQEIRDRMALRNELHSICSKDKLNPKLRDQMTKMIAWWGKHANADRHMLEEKMGIVNKLKQMISDPGNEKCVRLNECGHLCCGLFGEDRCPPCLFCSPVLNQRADDNCIICQDTLSSTPVIHLKCGHVYHAECVQEQLKKRYPGPRISFTFTLCPTCKEPIDHPSLSDLLTEIQKLEDEVQKKSLKRLTETKQDRAADIHRHGGRFYKNPTGYAMHKYAYYQCSKCFQAYYGGEAACDRDAAVANEEAGRDFKPEELLCVRCSGAGNMPICEHGTDFQGYKCRYCCSMAIFYCFGNTHFCDKCHSGHARLMGSRNYPECPVAPGGVAAAPGSPCPLKIRHPPTGQEFYMGCSICLEKAEDY